MAGGRGHEGEGEEGGVVGTEEGGEGGWNEGIGGEGLGGKEAGGERGKEEGVADVGCARREGRTNICRGKRKLKHNYKVGLHKRPVFIVYVCLLVPALA